MGLDGDITVKGTTQSVDVDFDELFDEVDYAVQLHFEAKKGDWSLIVDPTIIKVDSGQKIGPINVDIELDYVLTELLVGYRVTWDIQIPRRTQTKLCAPPLDKTRYEIFGAYCETISNYPHSVYATLGHKPG